MDLTARREAAQQEHRRQLQQRLDHERVAGEKERERQLLESLAAGEDTDRMKRATRMLHYYRTLCSGRWAPHAEAQIVHDTQLDGGAAVQVADRAAQEAVAAALEPLIRGMETELRQATGERDQLVERERPQGLVGWVRC